MAVARVRQFLMQNKTHKTLRIYTSTSGKEPFSEWLTSIKDRSTRARIKRRLDRVETGHYGEITNL